MAKRIAVIGGGIVGLATAWQLSRRLPGARVSVFEKEPGVGRHQSSHNSGVLHCGLYYKPGSLKARLAVQGIREMTAFCREHSIPHEICGKLVVAVDDTELARLHALEERGRQNGLQGLRRLGRDEMLEVEPHVAGVAGLHVPEEGIVDYPAVCAALASGLGATGGSVVLNAKVLTLEERSGTWALGTAAGDFEADYLVNCAGLHSDRIASLAGERRDVRIVPFRGEYFTLRAGRRHLVRHLIYPVPDPEFPFLGVHFTRMIHGGVEAGPNAVLAMAREGYRKTDVNPLDLLDAVTFPGLWRFLEQHRDMCGQEILRSFSRRRFCQSLQRLVPEVREEDLEPGGAGVRAQAMAPDGTLIQDFHLLELPGALHVVNAPSPAATASLAIGGEIAARVAVAAALR